MSQLKSICVYCGSSTSNEPGYIKAAETLGTELGQFGRNLVYGGASVGIMGAIADATLANGGEVLGIMPGSLVEKEVQHEGLTELVVVSSMHERKAKMVEAADGFIAMPGGFGTLDELFETLTWSQLGYHHKPIGLLNIQGYFDDLLRFLKGAVNKQLIKATHLETLLVSDNSLELLQKMERYEAPITDKWQ